MITDYNDKFGLSGNGNDEKWKCQDEYDKSDKTVRHNYNVNNDNLNDDKTHENYEKCNKNNGDNACNTFHNDQKDNYRKTDKNEVYCMVFCRRWLDERKNYDKDGRPGPTWLEVFSPWLLTASKDNKPQLYLVLLYRPYIRTSIQLTRRVG